MQPQHYPRFKKRVPCEFDDGEGHHERGIVLNLSRNGLFIRSSISPRVGAHVKLDLSLGSSLESIPLQARVVWKRRVHRSAASVVDGGIGLELETDSAEYQQFVRALESRGQDTVLRHAQPEALPETSVRQSTTRFSVRLALFGTPRTRCVKVSAATSERAGELALGQAGAGWKLLDVTSLMRFHPATPE